MYSGLVDRSKLQLSVVSAVSTKIVLACNCVANKLLRTVFHVVLYDQSHLVMAVTKIVHAAVPPLSRTGLSVVSDIQDLVL